MSAFTPGVFMFCCHCLKLTLDDTLYISIVIVHIAHLRVFEVLRVLGAELAVRDLAHDAVLVSQQDSQRSASPLARARRAAQARWLSGTQAEGGTRP